MAKDAIKMTGIVKKAFSIREFEIELENGIVVRGTISGKMKIHHIRILPGDKVEVELSPYGLTLGRITYRY